MLALKPEEDTKRSEDIKQALTKLEQAFKMAKRGEQQETAKRQRESQKELGQFWKPLNDEKLSKALGEAKEKLQQFGQSESMSPEAKAFRDQLREMLRSGDAKELQKSLAEMLEKAESLQKPGATSEEQRQGAKELKESLQELADAVASEAPSDQLKETLQRAIEQMQMAQNQGLQKDAVEGAQDSMEQLQQQMENLAQQLEQLLQLEEALDAAQLAQQLNEMGKMPGEGGEGEGKGMSSYADLYKKLLAEGGGQGQGPGPGRGGRGTGDGGDAPFDESLETGFKTEKSKSHLAAGKTLLEWQTNAVSETGEAKKAYQDSIGQIKQGLSEAIRQEKVPAGYHGQIQSYFDTLEVEPPNTEGLD
jgi:DNA repair exonuclease SbcCD ATPase subunit